MPETAAAETAQKAPAPKEAKGKKKGPGVESLSGSQKAAAVIVALGAEKASLLYKYMEDDDVEQLTLEVAKLGFLDSSVTEEILIEFHQSCLTQKAVTEGGLEYARTVLEKAYGEKAAAVVLGKVTKSLKDREFSFMDKNDTKSMFLPLYNVWPNALSVTISFVLR